MSEIKQGNKVRHVNKKVLIAAVLCVALLAIGTVGAATGAFDGFKIFNFPYKSPFSKVSEEYIQHEATPMDPSVSYSEQDKIMSEFVDDVRPGELRVAYYLNSDGGGYGTHQAPYYGFQNFENEYEYIRNSNVAMPLPSYIPEGYEFNYGNIFLYLDTVVLEAEPISSEIIDDVNCLIFQLPDGYDKNVVHYSIQYKNESGNTINISSTIIPRYTEDDGVTGFGAAESATAKRVRIDGYPSCMLIYDSEKEYGYTYELILYKEIEPVEDAMIVSMIMDKNLGYDFPENTYVEVLDALMITITGDDISKDEIMKIGENLN